jgi:tRNA-Thr(GGU) m(6)t(6)A37 methyltransferase TsaA
MTKEITLQPIGRIETPFRTRQELAVPPYHPDAPYRDPNVTGTVHIFEEFREGIANIQPGCCAMLIFYFHQSKGYRLTTTSPRWKGEVGVFSTRSPNRPNGIGVSIVRFLEIDGCKLTFRGVDMLDGTPLLDIKPYWGEEPVV